MLGQGGMGVVAKCTHLGLNEHVAIKMLRQDVLLDRDATERFTREAQSASKLKSEHVARVVDVGVFETGVPYMVMEFLDGHDLGDLVDDRGPLQAPFAAMLMLQAAEALAEAHSIGIVHRDVKPSNLFVSWRPDGSALVKVLDFGISKAPSGTDMKLTQTQSLLGTPAYMSPEQMRSARLVDARTDIWSLGTVFYELLEGRRPFEAESFSEMCVKVAVDAPSPMVNAPPALQAIIQRCLAKNPDQRYASMAELGRDLLPHVQDVHQASLLVERMQRVLGRARSSAVNAENWDNPSTGVSGRPLMVRDAASAPVQVPWHGGSDPLAVSMPTPSPFTRPSVTPDPRAPVQTLREESKPARALSEVVSIPEAPKRKSKGKLIVLTAIVLGVGAGIFVTTQMTSSEPVTSSTVAPVETKIEVTAKPAGDGSAAAATAGSDAAAKPTAPKPDDSKGSGAGSGEIEMPSDTVAGTTPTVPVKPPGTTRNPGATRQIKPPYVRRGQPKPEISKPVVGDGSAKTVIKPGEGSAKPAIVTPPADGRKPCTLFDKKDGKWPAHCAPPVK
jgi:serine/threonine protein kinase